jgi:hypothetical protein
MSSKIKELIKKIAGTEVSAALIFSAEVVSVEGETCKIDYAGLHLSDVNLAAVSNASVQNLLITPKVGSIVMVADLSNGDKRILNLVSWSEIDSIRINGGTLGGLVKVNELKTQLAKVTKRLDDVISALKNGVPATGAADGGSAYKTSVVSYLNAITDKENYANIEDPKITH